jgi:hypothetical protein
LTHDIGCVAGYVNRVVVEIDRKSALIAFERRKEIDEIVNAARSRVRFMMGGEEDHFMDVMGESVGRQTLHEDGWAYESSILIG